MNFRLSICECGLRTLISESGSRDSSTRVRVCSRSLRMTGLSPPCLTKRDKGGGRHEDCGPINPGRRADEGARPYMAIAEGRDSSTRVPHVLTLAQNDRHTIPPNENRVGWGMDFVRMADRSVRPTQAPAPWAAGCEAAGKRTTNSAPPSGLF